MVKKSPQEHFAIESRAQEGKIIIILGRKLAPPAKRIVLPQNGLKIKGAKVSRIDKRGMTELTVKRVNHLPTMNQVRIHTEEVVYPGEYELRLTPKS